MAINANNVWSNEHSCITCASGNGKGIAVQNLDIFKKDSCLIIFDPYSEYQKFGSRKAHAYKTRRGFANAFRHAWNSKKSFVLVYQPQNDDKIEEIEWFGQLAWLAADGNRRLDLLFEEYGKCTTSIAKDDTIVGEIVTGGRKFGMRAGLVFQRSAEVPKTIWSNTTRKIIGAQEFTTDAKRITEQLKCSIDDVIELGVLNNKFAMQHEKYGTNVRVKCHYLVGTGLGEFQRKAAIVPQNRNLMEKWSDEQKKLHKNSQFELVN